MIEGVNVGVIYPHLVGVLDRSAMGSTSFKGLRIPCLTCHRLAYREKLRGVYLSCAQCLREMTSRWAGWSRVAQVMDGVFWRGIGSAIDLMKYVKTLFDLMMTKYTKSTTSCPTRFHTGLQQEDGREYSESWLTYRQAK